MFTAEIGHALTRAERRGLISPADGAMKLSDILASLPDLYPSLPILTRAYQNEPDGGGLATGGEAQAPQTGRLITEATRQILRAMERGWKR